MLRLAVSKHEAALLDDIEELAFGELYDIESDKGGTAAVEVREVDERFARFLKTLRERKAFTRVTVHESSPTAAECEIKLSSGRYALKKYRF